MSGLKNISLRQIQAFLAVAELGSFTRAAERLNMSQPALSLLVRQIEGELSLRLFDRTSRRTELTSGGREFEQVMRRLMADFDLAIDNATALASRKRGRLVIAAPPTFSAVLLPQAIAEFQGAFPGVQIVLRDTTDNITDLVRSGEVDLGVGTISPGEGEIDRKVLVRDTLMLICHATSDLSRLDRIGWRDLDGCPLIALTRESGVRHLVDTGYQRVGLEARPAFEVSSMNTALAFVEAELGITILPTYALALARSKATLAKPLVDPEVSREICAIFRRGRSLPPSGDQFVAILRRWARRSVPMAARR